MDYAFEYVISKGGLCTEDTYAYISGSTGTSYSCKENNCSKDGAISSYTDVAESEEALMSAVANQPVSIAIEADQNAFQFYNSGVMDGNCGSSLDHGVLAVGYGTDNGSQYWKVKNSWGATWGEDGYIRMVKGTGKNNGAGQCGILLSASYPVV